MNIFKKVFLLLCIVSLVSGSDLIAGRKNNRKAKKSLKSKNRRKNPWRKFHYKGNVSPTESEVQHDRFDMTKIKKSKKTIKKKSPRFNIFGRRCDSCKKIVGMKHKCPNRRSSIK